MVTATVIHVLQDFPTHGKVMRMVSHLLRLKRLVGVLTAISLHLGPDELRLPVADLLPPLLKPTLKG